MSLITEDDIERLKPVKTFYKLFVQSNMARLIVVELIECYVNDTFRGSNSLILRHIKDHLIAFICNDSRKKG